MKKWFRYSVTESLQILAFATLYATVVVLTWHFLANQNRATSLWLPGGLALAGLMVAGLRFWPAIALGDLCGHFLLGFPTQAMSASMFDTTVEAVTAAWLIQLHQPGVPPFSRLRQYVWFCASIAIANLLGDTLGMVLSWINSDIPDTLPLQQMILHWQGDVLGMLILTPLAVLWLNPPRHWLQQERLIEAVICFGLTILAGQIIFLGWLHQQVGQYAEDFMAFVFVAWAGVRLGRHGVSLALAILSIQALVGGMGDHSYFSQSAPVGSQANYWFFTVIITLIGMSLALALQERMQAEADLREREQRLSAMFELSPLGMARNTLDGRYVEANPALLNMVGYPLAELNRLSYWDLTPPRYASLDQHQAKLLIQQGRYGPYEKEYIHHNGQLIPVRLNGMLITGGEGERYVWSIIENITDQRHAEEEMQLASLVYTNSNEAMSVSDAKNAILAINPAFTRLTGYQRDEIVGGNTRLLRSDRHDERFYQEMSDAIRLNGQWQGEIWVKRKSGEDFVAWLGVNTILNEDGTVHRRVAQFQDISEKKKSEELIWQQANFDPLTGLPNRHMFHDRLQQEIKKSHRTGLSLALIFLDLDHFKAVNDTLGHAMGDQLLKDVASRLTATVRESDTVVRLGGDEFTLILSELEDTHIAERVARDLLARLVEPFQLGDDLTYISASIGITFYPDDATDVDSLIKHADQAMYAAKQRGRNRYNFFTPSMQESVEKRMRLANELRIAISGEQFTLYYQPIVELSSGRIQKAEALIRWVHPKHGRISPADFIPIAEETGLINEIGNWVFLEAARQVKIWRERYQPDMQISVNKSPIQFRSEAHHESVWIDHLKSLNLPGHCMVVEITEGLLMDAGEAVSRRLLAFRDAGIQVALDDFGTGYSSLSYLKKFDIDYLKIDQSFVRNLTPDSPDLALCEAIIVMAHKLGIKVVAEGVETEQQRNLLIGAQCDYAQGYWYSRPVPATEFDLLLQQNPLSVARPAA
ncbi:diguanylate cyclase (GGDEF)-like protein/PAS domain S-box-containing protein [Chitinivorax tropicus]|uniref:Diguanylate cyclase (GGDEF)-like protein/PAS domain S-box-containing protein n=1 Tax=Chitinivorax tropicus TaxID=714531 RepID=A0A840MJP3_9PROT|nr:EAL domain-containing protein [Chitinivorax tropicus]MBB5016912.1 diguanylate cyclase (GGDEF)-like protein/PAS domain S-box-containing protein [Chitinivorax tropicus]